MRNEELRNLYSSYVIRSTTWAKHIARVAEKINSCTVLGRKP
jgi:hypothetical protein